MCAWEVHGRAWEGHERCGECALGASGCMGVHRGGWDAWLGWLHGVCTLGWTGEALCVCKRRRRSAEALERHVVMIVLECRLARAEQASLAC